jgi:hypothetical protein
MKKNTFVRFIEISIAKGKKEKVIYDNGLDLINFLDEYSKINNILLSSIYGEETSGIISDFISDSIYDDLEKNKSMYVVYDKDENIIANCSNIDDLYDYCESERLRLISENYSYEMKPDMTEEERMEIIRDMFKK